MTEALQQGASAPSVRGANTGLEARRIRFVATAPAGAHVARQFAEPRSVVAIEDALATEAWVEEASGADGSAQFVLVVCTKTHGGSAARGNGALPAALREAGTFSLEISRGAEWLRWRPGAAILQCRPENRGAIVAALIEFAFYERELRQLEQRVAAGHLAIEKDIHLGQHVRRVDRRAWPRLFDAAERFCRARLEFSRLEPMLWTKSRELPLLARKWLARLRQKADVEGRLEALSDRLEALEEFYEAATQRVSEHRWYREGHLLEIGILLLLLFECALMGGDIYLHQRHSPTPDALHAE
jgi:hypothetical protein